MSEDERGAAVSAAGTSRDDNAAFDSGDGGNTLLQLQSQISELSRKHDVVMSSIANLGDVQTRSVVYIPREKNITPFCGETGKDVYTVDEFIEEVERAMRARGLRGEEQVDFLLSSLKGSALEEVKLRMGGQPKQLRDLFSYLRDAFREKRTTPQLLHAFYARRQVDGEDLRDFSHALSQLLNLTLQQSPNAVTDVQLTLRDQFIEGVRDSTLRRELRRLVRERPGSSLFEVRDEAMLWTLEDRPRTMNTARNRSLMGDNADEVPGKPATPSSGQNDLSVTLQEVVKIVSQQGKAISELTNAVRELTIKSASSKSGSMRDRPRAQPRYTSDGQPICLRCEGVGHLAKQCTAPWKPANQFTTSPNTSVQENRHPPLL